MQDINNANLEFRKIKSLNFLYEINSNGTILRNVKSKRHISIRLDFHHSNYGYYESSVRIGDKVRRVMIHSAVAECWLGDRPEGYQVDHIDRNAHNNDYRNLRYVTHSEQMKNRDHTNIAKKGSENLARARELRKKPVILVDKDGNEQFFGSYADCARFLSEKYNKTFESMRSRVRGHRSHIFDYDVIYLNAETRHGNSTE